MSLVVRQNGYGVGLFTTSPLKQGVQIAQMRGPIVSKDQTPNFQVGTNTWMGSMGYFLDAVNHSCVPNLVAMVELPGRPVKTIRPVPAGAELTADYSLTSTDPSNGAFPCLCGQPSCRGLAGGGFHTIPQWLVRRYLQLGVVPRYVLDHYLPLLVG